MSRGSPNSQKDAEGLDTQGMTLWVSFEGGKVKVISVISELFLFALCQLLKSKALILLSLELATSFTLSPSGIASIGPFKLLL